MTEEKFKSLIKAQLKTCYTPEATVEMVFKIVTEHGEEKYMEGYENGVHKMAKKADDVHREMILEIRNQKSEVLT